MVAKRVSMMICNARIRAARSRLPFNLKRADIVIPDFCPVFRVPFSRGSGTSRLYFSQSMAPSIDRIDSMRGYTKNNIVIVSCRANSIKGDASLAELRAVAKFYTNLARQKLVSQRKEKQ